MITNPYAQIFAVLFLLARRVAAWALPVILTISAIVEMTDIHGGPPVPLIFCGLLGLAWVIIDTASHVRRVLLIANRADFFALSNRQRRRIEIPFEAGEAFDLIDAAIRELPGAREIESARDSLQIRARIKRSDPYGKLTQGKSGWFEKRNQILATVTPGDGTGSVTLICEPERTAWTDLFLVDDGTNLENAEAITRALARRVAEKRRQEQAAVKETITDKELAVAKLNLLHAQVEPHFLYNTLANAQYLTRTDPSRADEMLGNLILYLRHSLPSTGDTLSTLGAEVERARAYLDILKIRMGSRLQATIEVPEELLGIELPPMMLQTLVENAIKHGLEPKSGGGNVWIRAMRTGQQLAIVVADDGRGFSAEGSGTGIGLKNLRERLQLIYGRAASFTILSNFPSGVAATLTIPTEGAHHA
jgi:hypothetical protein